ncbi:TPA: hypothetical protein ACKP9T_005116 [Pseudomonas aeruginosa]|nr:hypothetical protein [Pseudomonas aeruginosa]MCT1021910.1 hypothetical protein [Pseudomonas aeruginosa]MCT1030041.1 hypothetical protein [Pseudomonas aeruginosa]MCT1048324.1 hypothetical protein [Pseudomonas aeruginosa]MCT1285183.1 hypothetical protein [Pseudomonas aeruginosa]
MSEFKREERYLVLKLKDLSPAAEEHIRQYVAARNLPNRQCVVVESDWPEYELVWTMIEARVAGRPSAMEILAAEAQALRKEVAQQKFLTKVENDALKMMTDKANELKSEVEQLEEELESLRARVVVTPDASTVYAALDARERLFTSPENIQVALEAQSRLNGLTVSEGLLRRLLDSDGIDGMFDAQQNYAAHQELRALLNEDKENGNG